MALYSIEAYAVGCKGSFKKFVYFGRKKGKITRYIMKFKLGKMSIDPQEIITAYVTKFNPTKEQQELADARIRICNECPNKKHEGKGKLGFWRCGVCGCALSGKIFTRREDACPEHRWKDVDLKYYNSRMDTIKKSGKLI